MLQMKRVQMYELLGIFCGADSTAGSHGIRTLLTDAFSVVKDERAVILTAGAAAYLLTILDIHPKAILFPN